MEAEASQESLPPQTDPDDEEPRASRSVHSPHVGQRVGPPESTYRPFAQPNTPQSVREQIAWDADTMFHCTLHHDKLATRWEQVTSWTRTVVTLTSGISALTILADSITAATVFAIMTACIAALNAGFSPPDRAKAHRDAAREYGHLVRPLGELLYKLDQTVYVSQSAHTSSGTAYDAGFYATYQMSDRELRDVWECFGELRNRIEKVDDTAPGLTSLSQSWKRWTKTGDQTFGDPTASAK